MCTIILFIVGFALLKMSTSNHTMFEKIYNSLDTPFEISYFSKAIESAVPGSIKTDDENAYDLLKPYFNEFKNTTIINYLNSMKATISSSESEETIFTSSNLDSIISVPYFEIYKSPVTVELKDDSRFIIYKILM